MSDIISRIKSPSDLVDSQGAKLLVYGISGGGKTTLCQTVPGKTLVISMEAGLLSIKDAKNVTAIEVKEDSGTYQYMLYLLLNSKKYEMKQQVRYTTSQ